MKILDILNDRFKPYPFVEHLRNKKFNEAVSKIVSKNEKWCILERISGMIIQIYYDDKGFEYGKGNGFFNNNKEKFFNVHNVLPQYEEKIRKIYEKYKKPIRIYGKLLGGYVNEKSKHVKGKFNVKKFVLNNEVKYCDDVNVIFFDITMGNKTIPYKKSLEIFKEYCIPYNRVLKICSLEEAFKYSNDFPSKIGKVHYNLPLRKGNSCLGIVIKPYEKEYGTVCKQRVIFKNTNPKFLIKNNKKRRITKYSQYSDKAKALLKRLNNNISEDKFETLFEKGSYEKKDLGKFTEIFVEDLIRDVKEDGFDFDEIKIREFNLIKKTIKLKSTLFFKDWFFEKVKKK